jgi:broad specificity phosphatase PhoE
MEIAVNVLGKRDGETGISSRGNKTRRAQTRKPVVIDDEIDVQADASAVQLAGERFESVFSSVECRTPRSPEIEAIIDVISTLKSP